MSQGSLRDPHKAHGDPSRLLNPRSSRPLPGKQHGGRTIVNCPSASGLNLEGGQRGFPGGALPSPGSPQRGRAARVFRTLGEGGQRAPSLSCGHTLGESHSGSIRSTGHTPPPTAAAPPPPCMPLVAALGPGHAPQERQTKGDCPPFVKRVEAPVGRLPVPDPDSFPAPLLRPLPPAGSSGSQYPHLSQDKKKSLQGVEASPGVQGFRGWREQGNSQALEEERGRGNGMRGNNLKPREGEASDAGENSVRKRKLTEARREYTGEAGISGGIFPI